MATWAGSAQFKFQYYVLRHLNILTFDYYLVNNFLEHVSQFFQERKRGT